MEQKPPRPMTPFDNLVTPPHLYTLKLMLPYTPPSVQRMLGIYIKFLELRHTMEYFHGFPASSSPSSILEELKEYMGPEEREQMEQMEGIMNMMEMMQSMQSMSDGDDAFNPMDFMKGVFDNE